MKNKLVLVEPSEVTIGVEGAKRSQEPAGLCIVGGYAQANGIDTSIVCPTSDDPTMSVGRILEQNPTHIGFGTFLYSLPRALELAKEVKKRNKDIEVIVGGNGVNVDAKAVSSNLDVDYVVKGEGVYPVHDLVKNVETKRGKIYKNGKLIVDSPVRTNLDDLSLPLRTKAMMNGRVRGDLTNPSQFDQEYATTFTTTGCANNCSFCQTQEMFPGSVFFRDPEKVVEEIEDCKNEFGSNYFLLTDPLAFGGVAGLRSGHAKKCADLLGKTGAKFYALTRLDMPSEYWDILQEAGVTKVGVGIESLVLKGVKDGTPNMYLDRINQYANEAIKRGIFCKGLFMVGYEGQTQEQISQEIEEIKGLKGLSDIRISWLTPFEKNAQEREALFKKGEIYTKDISQWSANEPIYKISGIENPTDAQALRSKMYKSFYGSGNADSVAKKLIGINPNIRESYRWFNENVLSKSDLEIKLD